MRATTLDIGQLATLGASRAVIQSSDDTPKCQTVKARLFNNEENETVEHFQQYGFHAVPVAPTMNGQEQQGAEAAVIFMAGQREHPVVVATTDRRFEPTNWKAGEAGIYDHNGASAKFTAQGYVHTQGSQKQPINFSTGKGSLNIADASVTMTDDKASVKVEGSKVTITDGSTTLVITGGKYYFGGAGASVPVMTANGPSSIMFTTS